MKYALQALENSHAYLPVKTGVEREVDQAAHFLRQAIAEAEKQPVHAIDMNQECVDETAKYRHDLVYRLRKRAEIRRQIPDRKSVQEGQPDRIADLLEEAADALEKREWAEQPDLARVGEVGIWGDKREWVGFTHEELAWLNEALNLGGRFAVIEAIEAKLKEKNT